MTTPRRSCVSPRADSCAWWPSARLRASCGRWPGRGPRRSCGDPHRAGVARPGAPWRGGCRLGVCAGCPSCSGAPGAGPSCGGAQPCASRRGARGAGHAARSARRTPKVAACLVSCSWTGQWWPVGPSARRHTSRPPPSHPPRGQRGRSAGVPLLGETSAPRSCRSAPARGRRRPGGHRCPPPGRGRRASGGVPARAAIPASRQTLSGGRTPGTSGRAGPAPPARPGGGGRRRPRRPPARPAAPPPARSARRRSACGALPCCAGPGPQGSASDPRRGRALVPVPVWEGQRAGPCTSGARSTGVAGSSSGRPSCGHTSGTGGSLHSPDHCLRCSGVACGGLKP